MELAGIDSVRLLRSEINSRIIIGRRSHLSDYSITVQLNATSSVYSGRKYRCTVHNGPLLVYNHAVQQGVDAIYSGLPPAIQQCWQLSS